MPTKRVAGPLRSAAPLRSPSSAPPMRRAGALPRRPTWLGWRCRAAGIPPRMITTRRHSKLIRSFARRRSPWAFETSPTGVRARRSRRSRNRSRTTHSARPATRTSRSFSGPRGKAKRHSRTCGAPWPSSPTTCRPSTRWHSCTTIAAGRATRPSSTSRRWSAVRHRCSMQTTRPSTTPGA